MRTVLKIGVGVLAGVTAFGLGFGTCYFLGMGKTTTTESTEGKNVNVSPVEDKSTEIVKEVPTSIVNNLVENIKDVYAAEYSTDYLNGLRTVPTEKVILKAIIDKTKYGSNTVTSEDVKNYITKYFGENYNYTDHSIQCPLDGQLTYIFDNTTKTYSYNTNHGGHGGTGYTISRDNYVKVLSSKYDGENIVLETKILYGTSCSDVCGPNTMYYANPNDTQPLLGNSSLSEAYVVTESDYESVKDKLDTTVFTFSRNSDGSYYLSDVKVKQD